MKRGRMQVKDIADRPVLELLARIERGEVKRVLPEGKTFGDGSREFAVRSATLYAGYPESIDQAMDLTAACDHPMNLVRAKMASMIRRGLVEGCACGCRGAFMLTDAGRAALEGGDSNG